MLGEESIEGVDQVSGSLRHPSSARVVNDPGDVDAANLQIDDEKNVVADQADESEYLDGEEVGGGDVAPVEPMLAFAH